MVKNRHFAMNTPDVFERERLGCLCDMADPVTTQRLSRLGITRGWRCVEVAAGTGSVARWMAEKVGARGHVVATDLDTRFLDGHEQTNLEVRRHNIQEDDLEVARYDVVHSRMILQHLANPLLALERMAAAVRPCGWLFVEECDWGSYQAADLDHPASGEFERRSRAIFDGLWSARMIDPYFGDRLPELIERLGLADIGYEATTMVSRGAGPGARFSQMSLAIVRRPLVAAGFVTGPECDWLHRAYDDCSFRFVDMTLFGAWGRRCD
jgi:ubiquinone/menaquinone biosynthesis C-methylase UbiE